MLLCARDATVTLCHSKTRDPAALCREADIVIAAAGKARFVDENYVKTGQVVLDVGVNEDFDGKICGDVAFDSVEPIVRAISPVPRGVGTVTTAILARHVVSAAERLF
jgi:methylenetetrahydrofolate dehydrogenase (NADP+)/methenyltetrahydrofolate cyclohydrolase